MTVNHNVFQVLYRDGRTEGPLSVQVVTDLIHAGIITANDMLCPQGGTPAPASTWPAFRGLFVSELQPLPPRPEGDDLDDLADWENAESTVQMDVSAGLPNLPLMPSRPMSDAEIEADLLAAEGVDDGPPLARAATISPDGQFSDLFNAEKLRAGPAPRSRPSASGVGFASTSTEGPVSISVRNPFAGRAAPPKAARASSTALPLQPTVEPYWRKTAQELRQALLDLTVPVILGIPASSSEEEVRYAHQQRRLLIAELPDVQSTSILVRASLHDLIAIVDEAFRVMSTPERWDTYTTQGSPPFRTFVNFQYSAVKPLDPAWSPLTAGIPVERTVAEEPPVVEARPTSSASSLDQINPILLGEMPPPVEPLSAPQPPWAGESAGTSGESLRRPSSSVSLDSLKRPGGASASMESIKRPSGASTSVDGLRRPSSSASLDSLKRPGGASASMESIKRPGGASASMDGLKRPSGASASMDQVRRPSGASQSTDRANLKRGAGSSQSTDRARRLEQFKGAAATGDGDPTEGPLVFSVGENQRGLLHTIPVVALALIICMVLVKVGGFGQNELQLHADELMIYIRGGVLVVLAVLALLVVRRESLARFGWIPDPLAFVGSIIAAAVLAGLGTFLAPVPLEEGASLGVVIGLLAIRAVTEPLFFHGYVTRTLLIEMKEPAGAVFLSAALYGLYTLSFAAILEGSALTIIYGVLVFGFGAGFPLAAIYWRTRSVLAVMLAQFIILGTLGFVAYSKLGA